MDEITLTVYVAASGQWAGTIFRGVEEIGGIAGCESAAEVEDAVIEMGYEIKTIKTV